MDYTLLRKQVFAPGELGQLPTWDVFLSAYNQSYRVTHIFDVVASHEKHWLVHPEYGFAESDLPTSGPVWKLTSRDEAEFWEQFFDDAGADAWPVDTRICIDSTGFMRPHLMLLLLLLRMRGFTFLQVVYSDPVAYESDDRTTFTKGPIQKVRQVRGFEGVHVPDAGDEDLLIIGAGYDAEPIRRVAEDKRAARKLQMFGLPSLQPHMYQENRFRAAAAEEAVGPLPARSLLFSPAYDPFTTAQELHETVEREKDKGLSNLYLTSLATKPQALGYAFYYLCELAGGPASMIFPYAESYSQETTVGLTRLWLYDFELDWFSVP